MSTGSTARSITCKKENSKVEAANKALTEQNKQLQQYIDDAAPFVGDGRLDAQSIAVVAESGVNGDVVKQTEAALRAAGADVPAVLWLEDSWQLDNDSRVQSLQSALGVQGTASQTRDAALDLLARRLVKAPKPTTSTTSSSSATTGRRTTGASGNTSTSSPSTRRRSTRWTRSRRPVS